MSEIKPVGHLITLITGDVLFVANVDEARTFAEKGWPVMVVYDESAIEQARADERRRESGKDQEQNG